MSEQNIVNVMVIPDVPKVLPGEQLYVYVPKASFTSPGIIAYNNTQFRIDGNFLFIRENYVSPGVQQKIDELKQYTDDKLQLKQDKEDNNISLAQRPEQKSVVGAINDLGTLTGQAQATADDAIRKIGDLSTLTTDEKTTIVGAINEVDNHADTAQQTANNATVLANTGISKAEQAQATANNAVATANEAKTTAQTAETNANSAVDTANAANATAGEAKAIAQGSQRAIGFATLKAAITALNGYSNTQLKVGDNVYIVETGVPDLWVAAVEQNSVAYNYTTNDAFNDDLVENTLVQVGYYKFAYLESDGKPCTVAWQNMTVAASDWVASTEFEDFAYEAKIALTDFVNFSSIPQVVFGLTEATSGNYAPICKAGDKGVYIYSKVNTEITLPTVVTFAPNVHGASMQGGGYTNKGKWVASTTYDIDDLVYTDNGQYVCIEGITSTTSPEQDTTHWQATFVATGKTKNGLTISGQNGNGTEVQKTFDGSQAVEVAFDETTMTVKEVNGVLEVGAKGTIPEALPQEASALKSGNLPTTGWGVSSSLWTGSKVMPYNPGYIGNIGKTWASSSDELEELPNGWQATINGVLYSNRTAKLDSDSSTRGIQFGITGTGVAAEEAFVRIYTNGDIYVWNNKSSETRTITQIGCSLLSKQTYTISDTSITANSDVLMELTDEGGVKAQALTNGSITVIRDSVPTSAIPYTYKVKQTNASGQFTVVNHYIPSVPETPTSLPVTYKKASGNLPTSGWTESGIKPYWDLSPTYAQVRGDYSSPIGTSTDLGIRTQKNNDALSVYCRQVNTTTFSWVTCTYNSVTVISGKSYKVYKDGSYGISIFVSADGSLQAQGTGSTGRYVSWQIQKIGLSTESQKAYTISDTDITANTAVKMYLTDEGGTKAYSKANGSITVIRDSVPTTAIPYEYEVEQTSEEGLFEVINAYVPTVPTDLAKTSTANTFTEVQIFSNTDGFKSNRAENINGNAWYDFDGTSDRLGSLATPTILRTSEARPKAEVPSGETTVTKEIALLEDVQGSEWAVNNDNSVFPKNGWYLISNMVVESYQLAPFIARVTSRNNKLVVATQDLEGHDVTLAMTIGSDRKFADAIRVHTYTIANNAVTAASTALSITTLLADGQFSFDYKLLY